jgi:hypothetical protein
MTITSDAIARALDTAPGWAKVALTVPQASLREDARREVAQHLYSALYQGVSTDRSTQMTLPL